jgi:hypothetical protein
MNAVLRAGFDRSRFVSTTCDTFCSVAYLIAFAGTLSTLRT